MDLHPDLGALADGTSCLHDQAPVRHTVLSPDSRSAPDDHGLPGLVANDGLRCWLARSRVKAARLHECIAACYVSLSVRVGPHMLTPHDRHTLPYHLFRAREHGVISSGSRHRPIADSGGGDVGASACLLLSKASGNRHEVRALPAREASEEIRGNGGSGNGR